MLFGAMEQDGVVFGIALLTNFCPKKNKKIVMDKKQKSKLKRFTFFSSKNHF
jgi:hypothetical protein